MFESHFIAMICASLLGGEPEVTHGFSVGFDIHKIRIDCETPLRVVEIGRDTRSSLDSVQQALFAAHLTGKAPMVLLVDTDGREGAIEYRVRIAAEAAGVEFRRLRGEDLIDHMLGS